MSVEPDFHFDVTQDSPPRRLAHDQPRTFSAWVPAHGSKRDPFADALEEKHLAFDERSLTVVVSLVIALAVSLPRAASTVRRPRPPRPSGSGTTRGGGQPRLRGASGTLNGSGSTFQKAFNDEAIAELPDTSPNLTVNYAGGGSGAGKTQLAANPPDYSFSGTDSTVKPEDLPTFKGGPILYFPTVVAPITVSYNLSGVSDLNLSAETLAKIFQGDITTWNDPAIAADNPGASLPSTPIVVARRAEASGTTSNFTKFLDGAGQGHWTLGSTDSRNGRPTPKPGRATRAWPRSSRTPPVRSATSTSRTPTPPDWSTASIKNKAGEFVAPTLEGASAAVANTTVKPDLTYDPINAAGADSYPITSPTWIILYSTQPNAGLVLAQQCWLNFLLTRAGLRRERRLRPAADQPAEPGRRAAVEDHHRLS